MTIQLSKTEKVVACVLAIGVLAIAIPQGYHLVRRLQDNRDRAAIVKDIQAIKTELKNEAATKGRPLTNDEAKAMIESPAHINPHTDKPYHYVLANDSSELKDGDIAYGVDLPCAANATVPYLAYYYELPRVHEAGGSCTPVQ